jgi:hypothetical protein
MPNLQRLIAVEPDSPSAAEMRINLQRYLPDVSGTVHEMKAEDIIINGNELKGEVYDVVFALNVLYLLDQKLVRIILQKLFDELLTDDGSVIVSYPSRSDHPEYFLRILNALFSARGYIPNIEEMESLFQKVGFKLDRQYEMHCSCDNTNPDEDLLYLFSRRANRHITKEEFQATIRQVWPNEKTDNLYTSLLIFKKFVS